jgi:hypothetical protein
VTNSEDEGSPGGVVTGRKETDGGAARQGRETQIAIALRVEW